MFKDQEKYDRKIEIAFFVMLYLPHHHSFIKFLYLILFFVNYYIFTIDFVLFYDIVE